MKTNPIVFIMLIGFFIMSACTLTKEARQLKKTTADWRISSAVLEAYSDSPFAGTFLTLRKNKKFEHTSSGMLKSFEAGSWNSNQDTITLYYINTEQEIKLTRKVYIDRNSSTLIFEGDTLPIPMRLRILSSEL